MPNREMEPDRSERWTIAVDLTPRKVNGDYLLRDDEHARREWYEKHPKSWRLTEVAPIGSPLPVDEQGASDA